MLQRIMLQRIILQRKKVEKENTSLPLKLKIIVMLFIH